MVEVNFAHDFKIEYSSKSESYYLFDSQNKIIAIFPQEKRDFNFFSEYVELCVSNMETVFFHSFGKYKKFYKEMIGFKRKESILNKIEKFEAKQAEVRCRG